MLPFSQRMIPVVVAAVMMRNRPRIPWRVRFEVMGNFGWGILDREFWELWGMRAREARPYWRASRGVG